MPDSKLAQASSCYNVLMVIKTSHPQAVIDITQRIQDDIAIDNGLCSIVLQHTTAAITTADLDPGTDQDFLDFLQSLVPDLQWRHPHNPDHAPAHLLASLIGPSLVIPVTSGQLQLGTWQRVILVEFDGPRERQLTLTELAQ